MGVDDQRQEIGEFLRVGVFQRIKLDDRIAGGGDVQLLNKLSQQADVVGVVSDNNLVGAVGGFDGAFLRENRSNLRNQFRGLDILELENLDEPLPSLRHFGAGAIDEFGTDFGFLSLRNDEDRLAGLDGSKSFQRQCPIYEV